MARYLAIFTDIIDEKDVNGFVVMTGKEVVTYEDLANSITWEITIDFDGFNLTYSSGEDLLSRIEFKEITQEEYKMLKKLFNLKFGVFITEDYLIDIVNEESDEYNEESDEYDEESDSYFNSYGSDDDDDDY